MTSARPAFVLLAFATAQAVPCLAVVLRGRVIDLDGRPATEARLQIVGHAPQLAIRTPSGEFEQPLAGEPSQVEIAALDGPLEVLYPLDGLLPVPRDESVHVTVVVGKPERASISELLATRLVRLEATLADNGVRYDAARDSLSLSLARILERLELDESDLRHDVAFRREQALTAPEILRTVDQYLRELKDLRDGLRLYTPLVARDPAALTDLQDAMQQYNAAFTALNDNRRAFESQILDYWPAAAAGLLTKALADVYLEAVENVHKALVLPLNPSFVVLARTTHQHDRPERDELQAAEDTVTGAAERIDMRLPALEQRAGELRDALERP